MNLGKDISNLLKKQRRVYVKDLGVFSRIHSSSTFDQEKQAYLPPISYIGFDAKSTEGFDFTYYYQQVLETSYQNALSQLANQVSEIHAKISEDGSFHLSSLGQLIRYGNEYVFKPEDLSGFQFAAIEAQKPFANAQESVIPIEDTTQAPSQINIPLVDQPLVEEADLVDTYDAPKKSKGAVWFLIISLLALGVVVAIYFIDKNKLQQPYKMNEDIISENLDTASTIIAPMDSSALVSQDSVIDTVNNHSIDSVKLVSNTNENHRYQIVIATAPTLDKAHKIAEKYNELGVTTVKVIPSKMARNNKKVIWDTYATKAEVDSALLYVQKHHVADAWLDRIKK